MAKRHYIPVTADVPGVSDGQRAFLRRAIRTQVEDPLAELLLGGGLSPGGTAVVQAEENTLKIFSAPGEQNPAACVQVDCKQNKTKGESPL